MENIGTDNENLVNDSDSTIDQESEKACVGSVNIGQVNGITSTDEVKVPIEVIEGENVHEDLEVKDHGEDDLDPLNFISIKSAAQWKAISKRISWNFDENGSPEEEVKPEPQEVPTDTQASTAPKVTPVITSKEVPKLIHDYENARYDIYCPNFEDAPLDFKPTK